MTDRYLRVKDLAEYLGVTRQTIRAMHLRGELPKPVIITGQIKAWRQSEIDQFLASKSA